MGTDITYIRVKQQWLYLAVVIDLYSRQVIGWALGERINADLVCHALKSALHKRGKPKGVIVHTDRGSQYCSRRYQRLIKAQGMHASMSDKGNCFENEVSAKPQYDLRELISHAQSGMDLSANLHLR